MSLTWRLTNTKFPSFPFTPPLHTPSSNLDPVVKSFFDTLPLPADKVRAEYIWIDRDGATRSKTRTLPKAKTSLEQVRAGRGGGGGRQAGRHACL